MQIKDNCESRLIKSGQTAKCEKEKKKSVSQYGPRGRTSEIVDVIENMDAEVVIELTPTNITDGEPGKNHIITMGNLVRT